MVKILFVCHGNICRSPMAACLFSQMAKARGLDCVVSSAATSREEIGNPMYPPAQAQAKGNGGALWPSSGGADDQGGLWSL